MAYGDLITTHVDKLMAAHVMAHVLASDTSGRDMITELADVGEGLNELAREHNQAKQRGLYADLLDDTVWEPASVTADEARRMVVTVEGLLDHGGQLADPGFVAWLASQTQEVLEVKDMVWARFFAGLQQGGPEGMFASLRSLMDETGAAEGFPQMIRKQARRTAITEVAGSNRVQPRRLPRRQRRAH